MGEPGTQLSVWALSSAASHRLAWAHQGWAVGLSSGSAPQWGGWRGAYARSVTALNWNLTPASAVLLLFLPWPLSVPPRTLGRKSVVVDKCAGAHSSLGHRKWLAGPRLVCRNCVDSFCSPRKEFWCVLPCLLTESRHVGGHSRGWGSLFSGGDAIVCSGL